MSPSGSTAIEFDCQRSDASANERVLTGEHAVEMLLMALASNLMCLSVLFKGISSCLKYGDENKYPAVSVILEHIHVRSLSLQREDVREGGKEEKSLLPFICLSGSLLSFKHGCMAHFLPG